jgi:iron-sulfur cluster assembly protein
MSDDLKFTDAAARKVGELIREEGNPNLKLRVFVSGGGCSGMQYGMALEAEARPYDHVIERDGVKVFIDPTSMMYLSGAAIDYEDNLMGGGFRIDNPNAVSSCGCGHSFKTAAHGADDHAGHASGGGCGCG